MDAESELQSGELEASAAARRAALRAEGFHAARGARWGTREELVKILMAKQGIVDERDIPPEIEAIANEMVELRQEVEANPRLIWDLHFANTASSVLDWRRTLHRFLERPDSSRAAWWFNVAYFVFLALAMAWNVLETLPTLRTEHAETVEVVDVVLGGLYCAEILVRLCAVRYWKEYLLEIGTWVDWVTLVSFVIHLAGLADTREILVLEIFRHFRPIQRLLKETRRFAGIQLLVKALQNSADALLIPLFTVLLFALLSGNFLYVAERDAPSPSDPSAANFESLEQSGWMVIYTVSTVGYGNAPVTVEGKIVTSVIIIAGIIFLAIPISVVGANFDRLWKLKELMTFMDMVKRKLQDYGLDPHNLEFIFQSFDLSKDGLLDFGEFGQCVRKVGLKFKIDVLSDMFRIFDDDASGIVTYREFLKGLQGKSIFPSRVLFEGIHGPVTFASSEAEHEHAGSESRIRIRNRRVLVSRGAVLEDALNWIPGLLTSPQRGNSRSAIVREP